METKSQEATSGASPEFLRARTIDVSAGGADAPAVMIRGFLLAIGALRAVFLSQAYLVLENPALASRKDAFANLDASRPTLSPCGIRKCLPLTVLGCETFARLSAAGVGVASATASHRSG